MFIFSAVSAIVGSHLAVVRGFPDPLDTDQDGRVDHTRNEGPRCPSALGSLDHAVKESARSR